MQLRNYQFEKYFAVWSDEIRGILSPLYYISTPKKTQGLVPLNEVAIINPPRSRPKLDSDAKVAYVGLPETDNKKIQTILYRPYKEVAGRSIIHKGDILFARIEPSIFNKKYIYVDDLAGAEYAYTSTEFYIIEARKNINPIYLFSILFSDNVYNQIVGKTTGSTGRRRLDKSALENVLIPFPSIGIQKEIAELYLETENLKGNKEKQAHELLSSIDRFILNKIDITINNADTGPGFIVWNSEIEGRIDSPYYRPFYTNLTRQLDDNPNIIRFDEIIEELSGGATPTVTGNYYVSEGGIPFLRVQNITEDGILLEDVKYIRTEVHEGQLRRSQLKKDDLVFTITGRIGSVAVCPDNFAGNINQHSVRIKLKRKYKEVVINPHYIAIYFNSSIGRMVSAREVTGGTRPALDYKALRSLRVILPLEVIQNEIVEEVNQIKRETESLLNDANSSLLKAKTKIEQMILEK